MATIGFHSMADSAYLWTAMHVADEKGVDHELIPLVLGSPEHLALNPFGKMPVMRHEGVVLYETLAITHYVNQTFVGPPLQPTDALDQAEVLRWINIVNAYVFPTMNRFVKERLVKPAWGFAMDENFLREAQAPLELRVIGEAAGKDGFLVGPTLTLADSFLLPRLLFFAQTPEGAALVERTPPAARWLARMQDRPSYSASPIVNALELVQQYSAPTGFYWTGA